MFFYKRLHLYKKMKIHCDILLLTRSLNYLLKVCLGGIVSIVFPLTKAFWQPIIVLQRDGDKISYGSLYKFKSDYDQEITYQPMTS